MIPMMEAIMPPAITIRGYLAAEVAVKVDMIPDVSTATPESRAAEQAERMYVST